MTAFHFVLGLFVLACYYIAGECDRPLDYIPR
jgi:hypothetical protein